MDRRVVVDDQIEVDEEPLAVTVAAAAAVEQDGADAGAMCSPRRVGDRCHGGIGGRGQLPGHDRPQCS